MPTIDIDGRGNTVKEAVQDMWARIAPLEAKGYQPTSSVEVVDTKTNKVVESFQMTDQEWASLRPGDKAPEKKKQEEHRPPTAHEYKFKARITMQG